MRELARTTLLIACFGVALAAAAGELAGPEYFVPVLAAAVACALVLMCAAGPLVLRLYRARPADETSAPGVVKLMRELAGRVALPAPRVWIIDDPAPTAFATGLGPRRAAVALTTGLISLLTERELRAVLAHELAHIQRRETRTAALGVAIAGALPMLAMAGLTALGLGGDDEDDGEPGAAAWLLAALAPLGAAIVLLTLDGRREFEADRWAATLCGDPGALADALAKIEQVAGVAPPRAARRHPQTAALLILAPGAGGGWRRLLSPHPPTAGRIARLLALADDPRTQV